MRKLSTREKLFCRHYIKNHNASEAALTAGYSKKTRGVIGHELMRRPRVAEEIARLERKLTKKVDVTLEKVIKELATVAFMDLKDCVDVDPDSGAIQIKGWDDMPEGASRAVESVQEDRIIREDKKGETTILHDKVKIRRFDKVKALQILKDHLDKSGQIQFSVTPNDLKTPKSAARVLAAYQQLLRDTSKSG